jgi:hypothetical protein
MIGPSKGALRSGADLMKIQAQAIAETAEQHERNQEDRERRFVALVHSYLSEHGYIAALKDPCPTQTAKLFAATCSRDDISDDDLGLVFYKAMLEEIVV